MKLPGKLAAIATVLVFAVLVQRLELEPQASSGQVVRGKVIDIVDGDSLYLRGHDKQIRLWAVDAPESSEPGYDAATQTLKSLAGGKRLSCYVQAIDKYDRTVARCENETGEDINRAMLLSGKAQEYCRFSNNFYGFCD